MVKETVRMKALVGKNKITDKNVIIYFVIALISCLFCLLFSFTTSILYNVHGGDSSIFKAVGKLWYNGQIPYLECFDHKGPFLFFIEYIGYGLNSERIGIFIIQLLFMIVSAIGLYKIISQLTEKYSLFLTIICIGVLSFFYEGGNLSEEYCLPFLIWSLYFVILYLQDDKNYEHKPCYAFLYGITFMVGVLTRITNAMPICCGILIIFIRLIINKKWKNVLYNALMFFLGNVILLLPFIIYFLYKNALYEMVYGTIIYNFKYAANPSAHNVFAIVKQITPLFIVFVSGLIGIIKDYKFRYIYALLLVMAGASIVMQLLGESYAHYLMIWMPAIAISLGCLRRLYMLLYNKKILKTIILLTLVLFIALVGIKNVKMIMDSYNTYYNKSSIKTMTLSKDIVKSISEENKVIGYNVGASFYLYTDIRPCYRFFILQDWQMSKDLRMYDEFRNDILSCEADYIVVGTEAKNVLDEEIYSNYKVIKENEMFKLLQLE